MRSKREDSRPSTTKSMSLQSRFLLGTGIILLVLCCISAYATYRHEKRKLEEWAYTKSQLVMVAVEASQNYVREVLRPKMFDLLGQEAFVLEAMSTSYVSRQFMERFRDALPEYEYRRVAVNARNPLYEANAVEKDMIDFFAHHTELEDWQGLVKEDRGAYYKRVRPVYFSQSCLHCHGDPAQSPRALLEVYGPDRGFGRKAGELGGLITVGIPVDQAMVEIKERATSTFLLVFLALSIFYLALIFFFHQVVVINLHSILNIFKEKAGEDQDQPSPVQQDNRPGDEIEELTLAAETMADHLRETREKLRQYAQDLEKKVARRTAALQESEERLKNKVRERNLELQTLNTIAELNTRSTELSEILPRVLDQTLRMIPARGGGIYLLQGSRNGLVLQYEKDSRNLAPAMPFEEHICPQILAGEVSTLHEAIQQASCGKMNFLSTGGSSNCLNIPLSCRGKVLGVMTFTDVNLLEISPELNDLLVSIGRQVGITIESFNNLQEVLHSKELLQSVFDGITDQVVLLDRDYRIRMVNKAYLERYDVALQEIENRHCHEIHGSGAGPCRRCELEKVCRQGKPVSQEVTCPSGEVFLVHFYPVLDGQGQVESVIRYAREISDQKRVEQRIQQTEKLVALGQLAAGVAHEINNPLGVILCYVDLLKRQLTELPRGLEDLATIEKQALNCKRIVSDLLKFSRSQESPKLPVSVNRALEDVLKMLEPHFRKHGVRVSLELEDHLPFVPLDLERVKQVFLNLLMNACQAVAPQGQIRISSAHHAAEGMVEVTFWDNGHGISPSLQDKVFDPFFTTKKTGEGTGLGLSVSYGIIQEHGGEILVESEPGQWTRFTVRLPVQKPFPMEDHAATTTAHH